MRLFHCGLRSRSGVAAAATSLLVFVAMGAAFAPDSPRQKTKPRSAAHSERPVRIRGALQSKPVAPNSFTGDLRHLPKTPLWQRNDPIVVGPPRRIVHESMSQTSRLPAGLEHDPLLDHQQQMRPQRGAGPGFTTPLLNIEGVGFSGVVPPDTVGAIGARYYIQMVNGPSGAIFQIFDKQNGDTVAGPTNLNALWTAGGACSAGWGDPIVLYDQLAGRWMMAEFAGSGNHLCVYISKIGDPISGGWFLYDFETPFFPDYPKYAVWPDAYYVASNEPGVPGGALEREKMLAGLPAASQRLGSSALAGFGFQALIPSDLDGPTAPPSGTPNFFMRHRDDEVHNVGSNNPTRDFLEIWAFHVDFEDPGNTTFSLMQTIPIAEFDSDLCGLTSSFCFPQPGTEQTLDPLREVIMWRLQYRNFGTYETLVGNFVTDVDGTDHGGIRWFELRRTGPGLWELSQEGTYAPDADHRWMGSLCMDGSGNLALGYSISSATTFPSVRYAGRMAGDSAGVLTMGEGAVINGSGFQTFADRWGDYSSMTVDPVDDCTFWYTNEYVPASGQWKTRIAALRFPTPACADAPATVCGNDQREVGEDCDGIDIGLCPPSLCQGDCTCPPPFCGNDATESGEECDGADAASCVSGLCGNACTCLPPPIGVCCDQDQGCTEMTESACTADGGVYLGPETMCQGTIGNPRLFAAQVNMAIPDQDTTGVSHTIDVSDSFVIGDVDIDFAVTHTWVSDLVGTITHNGTTVTIVDRPGVPDSPPGCDYWTSYDVVVDDEGTGGSIELVCASSLISPPNYTPNQPLGAFDGLDSAGVWTITFSDIVEYDVGTFHSWSLHIDEAAPNPCVCETDADCDDGVACTTDACDPGAVDADLKGCTNTTVDTVCKDGNICTVDFCNPVAGCINDGTGIAIACDDGNACTTGDACRGDAGGTCAGTDTSVTDCDDSNVCTRDYCNATTGCINDGTGITVPCDDEDPCTMDDRCLGDAAGTCAGTGTPVVDCNDNNICTTDSCDPETDCINDGTGITIPCDDENPCTEEDRCLGDALGTCIGTPHCRLYADVFPLGPPPGDCVVDLDDILEILTAFSDTNPCLDHPNTNLVPCGQACTLGVIDLDDILAVQAAFSADYGCTHPCPP